MYRGSYPQGVPSPNFMVFYNGTAKYPEYCEMRLSDAFMGQKEEPSLELKVKVVNINPGMNEALKKKCPILAEYSAYVETVRQYKKFLPLTDAVNKAIDECIKNNILKNFLLRQKAEVFKMSIFEYDEEREMERIRYSEREYGYQMGAIVTAIQTYDECGVSKEEILKRIIEKFKLKPEVAQEYIEQHYSQL